MHVATYAAFMDELVKLGFNIADAAAREGIELAKKLKSTGAYKNLKGPALKDYMHHMDLSAHPRFAQGVKTTVQAPTMPKLGSVGGHVAELAGLGILAAPTAAKHFGGKEWSSKNKRRAELVGLGTLAAPSALSLGKRLLK